MIRYFLDLSKEGKLLEIKYLARKFSLRFCFTVVLKRLMYVLVPTYYVPSPNKFNRFINRSLNLSFLERPELGSVILTAIR